MVLNRTLRLRFQNEDPQNQYNALVTEHPQPPQLILQVTGFEYTIDDDGNLTTIEFTVQPAEVHGVDDDDASDYSEEEEEESGDDDDSDYSEEEEESGDDDDSDYSEEEEESGDDDDSDYTEEEE